MLQTIVHPFVRDNQCEFYFIAIISFHKGSKKILCKPLHEGTLFALFEQYLITDSMYLSHKKKVPEASCLLIFYTVKTIFLTPKKPSGQFSTNQKCRDNLSFYKKAQLK